MDGWGRWRCHGGHGDSARVRAGEGGERPARPAAAGRVRSLRIALAGGWTQPLAFGVAGAAIAAASDRGGSEVAAPTTPIPAPSPRTDPLPRTGEPDAPADAGSAVGATAGDDSDVIVQIVARARAGDPEAFGELYDRYLDLVYRYVYYRVGGHAQAEDITSETFLRALRRISSFTWQGRDVGAWLVTIARNLVADHYKSARYRLELSSADMLAADRAADGPEGEVMDRLTNAALLDAVKRLGPEQQECVVLRFLHGLSVAETALAMGKNEGSIKALQYRGMRSLRRLLPEDMGP